jgi:spermidine/putrescine ABC transporter ATP-binding subunit
VVKIKKVTKKFGSFTAVKRVDLHIQEGDFLALLGPSGSGKTTTLIMLAGFEAPDKGDIHINDESVLDVPPHKRNIGMVFQNYALFPHLNVYENVVFPLKMRKIKKSEMMDKVEQTLDLVKLPGLESRYPSQLSGGQQQRIALARALVYDPPLLLMDEPLGALDKKLRDHMQLELKQIQKKTSTTIIYVTHDQEEALNMSNKIAVMKEGQIIQVGSPEEVYEKPANSFVAGFMGDSNFVEGEITNYQKGLIYIKIANGDVIKVKGDKYPGNKELKISIRPTKIRLEPKKDNNENFVQLKGQVADLRYIGEAIEYSVNVGIENLFSVKQHIREGTDMKKKGEEVFLSWNIKDASIL